MLRTAALGLSALLLAACAEEAGPAEPPPTSPEVGRSPDEQEPIEPPPPSVERSSGFAAAQHEEALRVLDTDATRAAEMLEGACDRGFAASCVALADVLEEGAPGVDTDLARARGLLEQACFAGSTSACDRLGH